jgi:hypothetical protein
MLAMDALGGNRIGMEPIIWDILTKYEEEAWQEQCRAVLPTGFDGEIVSMIEKLYCGGVEELLRRVGSAPEATVQHRSSWRVLCLSNDPKHPRH